MNIAAISADGTGYEGVDDTGHIGVGDTEGIDTGHVGADDAGGNNTDRTRVDCTWYSDQYRWNWRKVCNQLLDWNKYFIRKRKT